MIIQPNQRRRARMLRALAGVVVAVTIVAVVAASGWKLPQIAIAGSSPTLVAALPSPTAAATPTPLPPTPEPTLPPPTPLPNGCLPAPSDILPATVVSHGPRSAKVVALTFDDGTDPDNTRRILRTLRDKRVNATFFPTGRSVDLFPDLWHEIAAAGFPIGAHTYSHEELKGECYADQLKELERTPRLFSKLGLTMTPLMRPPYELYDDATLVAARASGAVDVVLWDVDTFDWTGVSTHQIKATALKGKAGSIILMHTSPRNTARALDEIIKRFRDRGYSFVTVGQLLGVPGPVPFP